MSKESIEALKAAYLRHVFKDSSLLWDEFETILESALIAEMGEDKFKKFIDKAEKEF